MEVYMKKYEYKISEKVYVLIFAIIILSFFFDSQDNIVFYTGITLLGIYSLFSGILEYLSRKRYMLNSIQIEGIVVESIKEPMP
jgi:hypothetical protein